MRLKFNDMVRAAGGGDDDSGDDAPDGPRATAGRGCGRERGRGRGGSDTSVVAASGAPTERWASRRVQPRAVGPLDAAAAAAAEQARRAAENNSRAERLAKRAAANHASQ